MKIAVREKALVMRKRGWSYNVIASRLNVSKSTLSHWLREIPYHANKEVLRRIGLGPAKSAMNRHNQKVESVIKMKIKGYSELGGIRKRDLWMLGLGLYLGEGSKLYEQVRIINSDPDIVRLAMKWLHSICKVPIKNFSIAIHMYPDTNGKQAMRFWSDVTGVPSGQFGKAQIDFRKNKSNKKQRKLPFGTAHITIKSCGNPSCGVRLHRRIMGWIAALYEQLRA